MSGEDESRVKRGGEKVKWEVVCLGREKERERGERPTGRGEKGREEARKRVCGKGKG